MSTNGLQSLARSAMVVVLLGMQVYVEILAAPVGSPFEATGRLEFSSFGTPAQSYSTEFHALIDDCQVSIRTKGFGNEPVEFCQFASTGTNSWTLEKFSDTFLVSNRVQIPGGGPLPPELARLNAPLKTPRRPNNTGTLYIKELPTPMTIGRVTPVWLAFAARCYLETQLEGEYLSDNSIFLMPPPNSAHRVRDRAYWRWSDENPRFLKSLSSLRSDSRARAPAEHTNAVFNVLTWTNVTGLNVPLWFEFSLFAIRPEKSSIPAMTVKIRGRTESFRLLATNLAISLPSQTDYSVNVFDERVRVDAEGSPFRHLAMDGRVPTLEEARAMAAAMREKAVQPTKVEAQWRRPSIVRIGFFTGAAVLSGFLLVKFLRARNEKSTNQ